MARGGRPTRLTPKLIERILEHVRIGAGLDVAGAHEGVNETQVWRWQKWGRELSQRLLNGEKLKLTVSQQRYVEFSQGIARARAEFEVNILRRLDTLDDCREVINPSTGELETVNKIDPKIAAALSKSLTWLLERTRRDTYGSQITVKVEEAKEYLLDALERVCDRMGQKAVLEALLDELERGGQEAAGEASPPAVH